MFKILDKIETLINETKGYAEAKYESVRLDSIQKSVEASSTIITWFIIGIVGFISLLLITLISGLALSAWLGSYIIGFGIVTLVFLSFLVILIIFRRRFFIDKIQNVLYGFFIQKK